MHVHRPKRAHGPGELAREIAIIVLGIVIAIGFEQAVKLFHHNHQREQLEAALRRDGQANRGYIKDDIANAQAILQWAVGEADALERAPPTGPLTLHRMPSAGIGSPDAGVWPSAKASGVSNLLPSSAQNWLEYQAEVSNETFVSQSGAVERLSSAYAGLDQALFGHATADASGAIDVSSLTAAQRSMVVERLRAIAEAARVVMRQLLIYDSAIEFIFSTPLDQLDTRQAADRYSRIYRATLASHPAASFVFGGH